MDLKKQHVFRVLHNSQIRWKLVFFLAVLTLSMILSCGEHQTNDSITLNEAAISPISSAYPTALEINAEQAHSLVNREIKGKVVGSGDLSGIKVYLNDALGAMSEVGITDTNGNFNFILSANVVFPVTLFAMRSDGSLAVLDGRSGATEALGIVNPLSQVTNRKLIGTAADGFALANKPVTLLDAKGKQIPVGNTNNKGEFTYTFKEDEITFPVVISAAVSSTQNLGAIATAPATSDALKIANVNPITQVVAQSTLGVDTPKILQRITSRSVQDQTRRQIAATLSSLDASTIDKIGVVITDRILGGGVSYGQFASQPYSAKTDDNSKAGNVPDVIIDSLKALDPISTVKASASKLADPADPTFGHELFKKPSYQAVFAGELSAQGRSTQDSTQILKDAVTTTSAGSVLQTSRRDARTLALTAAEQDAFFTNMGAIGTQLTTVTTNAQTSGVDTVKLPGLLTSTANAISEGLSNSKASNSNAVAAVSSNMARIGGNALITSVNTTSDTANTQDVNSLMNSVSTQVSKMITSQPVDLTSNNLDSTKLETQVNAFSSVMTTSMNATLQSNGTLSDENKKIMLESVSKQVSNTLTPYLSDFAKGNIPAAATNTANNVSTALAQGFAEVVAQTNAPDTATTSGVSGVSTQLLRGLADTVANASAKELKKIDMTSVTLPAAASNVSKNLATLASENTIRSISSTASSASDDSVSAVASAVAEQVLSEVTKLNLDLTGTTPPASATNLASNLSQALGPALITTVAESSNRKGDNLGAIIKSAASAAKDDLTSSADLTQGNVNITALSAQASTRANSSSIALEQTFQSLESGGVNIADVTQALVQGNVPPEAFAVIANQVSATLNSNANIINNIDTLTNVAGQTALATLEKGGSIADMQNSVAVTTSAINQILATNPGPQGGPSNAAAESAAKAIVSTINSLQSSGGSLADILSTTDSISSIVVVASNNPGVNLADVVSNVQDIVATNFVPGNAVNNGANVPGTAPVGGFSIGLNDLVQDAAVVNQAQQAQVQIQQNATNIQAQATTLLTQTQTAADQAVSQGLSLNNFNPVNAPVVPTELTTSINNNDPNNVVPGNPIQPITNPIINPVSPTDPNQITNPIINPIVNPIINPIINPITGTTDSNSTQTIITNNTVLDPNQTINGSFVPFIPPETISSTSSSPTSTTIPGTTSTTVHIASLGGFFVNGNNMLLGAQIYASPSANNGFALVQPTVQYVGTDRAPKIGLHLSTIVPIQNANISVTIINLFTQKSYTATLNGVSLDNAGVFTISPSTTFTISQANPPASITITGTHPFPIGFAEQNNVLYLDTKSLLTILNQGTNANVGLGYTIPYLLYISSNSIRFSNGSNSFSEAVGCFFVDPNTSVAPPSINTACNTALNSKLSGGVAGSFVNVPVPDTTSPTIISSVISPGNITLDVNFSEGIYTNDNGTGTVTMSDFNFIFSQNGGNAAGVTLTNITNTSGGPLSAGASSIRFNFTVTGVSKGVETLTVTPVAHQVFDSAGNVMNTASSTGLKLLNDQFPPTVSSSTVATGNNYIDITFPEGVFTNANGTGALTIADFNATIMQNGGNASVITLTSITSTTGGTLIGGETSVRINFTLTGTPTGVETINIAPITNQVYDASGNAMITASSTGNKNLTDLTAPTILNSTVATTNAYIDITFSEGIYTTPGSGAITASDFGISFTQADGTATNATIISVTKTSGAGVVGGDSIIRFNLNVTGTASGTEFIVIALVPNQVYDFNGNVMLMTSSTGTKNLSNVTATTITNATVDTNNTYIDVTFSEGIYTTPGSGGVITSDFTYTFAQNPGSGGTATNATLTSVTTTSSGALNGGETVVRFNGTVTGTPSGAETITISPVANQVYNFVGTAMSNASSTGLKNLTDKVAPAITAFTSSSSVFSTAITVSITGTDAVGVTAYYLSESNTTPAVNDVNWVSATSATSFSAPAAPFTLTSTAGAKTVYLFLKDVAGNISTSSNVALTLTPLMGGSVQTSPLTLSNAVTTFAGGASMTLNNPVGMVSDGSNLYFNDSNNHVVKKMNIATREVSILAGTFGTFGSANGTGTAATFNYPKGITIDHAFANLYVSDEQSSLIRKIVLSTKAVTTFAGTVGSFGYADGTGTAAVFNAPLGMAIDSTDSFMYVADQGNRIRKIDLSNAAVTTVSGNGTQGVVDGIGTAAQHGVPKSVAIDNTNTYLYTCDVMGAIRKITLSSGQVTTYAGDGTNGFADGTGTAARFYQSVDCAIDSTSSFLYVVDSFNQRVRKIDLSNAAVTTIAGSGATGSADGTGTAATFNFSGQFGSLITSGSDIYISDNGNNLIRKLVISSGVVTTVGGNGYSFTNGTGTAASFQGQIGVTTDGTNLYVSDTNTNQIRKIVIATGVVTTLAGNRNSGYADGTGTAALFNSPFGITTDGTNLYVSDANNNRIRKVVIATGVVTTFAGSGGTGLVNGTGTAAQFSTPRGITTDGTNLYVVDLGHYTIRKIEIATAAVTTLAGTSTAGTSIDGTGTAATFNYPVDIVTDGSNLYVAELLGNKIRKIVPSTGVVTTFAGSGTTGSTDGTGTAATFNNPSGITSDGTNLYLSEQGSSSIRKIVISSAVVTAVAGSGVGGNAVDATGTAAVFQNPEGLTTDGTYIYVTDSSNNKIRKIQ